MCAVTVLAERDGYDKGTDQRFLSHICGVCFCLLNREPIAKIEEGVAAPVSGGAARLRFFSMKRTVSQQSFDAVSLDNSGPEDRISVDSDGSDSFVMLVESGEWRQSQAASHESRGFSLPPLSRLAGCRRSSHLITSTFS